MSEKPDVSLPDFEGEKMKMPENSEPLVTTTEESSVVNGVLLTIITLLLLAILGGLYYWFIIMNTTVPAPVVTERPTAEQNTEPESTTARAQTDTMLTTSPSDEINAIEADIEATNLESLDMELQAIEAELEAALE